MPRALRHRPARPLAALLLAAAAAAQAPVAIADRTAEPPVVDGLLREWTGAASIRIERPDQVVAGAGWQGPDDASLVLWTAYDANHLYVAGQFTDDSAVGRRTALPGAPADAVELWLRPVFDEGEPAAARPDDLRLWLLPLHDKRPWSILEAQPGEPRPSGSSLTGFRVAGRPLDGGGFAFEAAIPFHQLANVRPGQPRLGFGVVLHDRDAGAPAGEGAADPAAAPEGERVSLSWTGVAHGRPGGLGWLALPGDGPLVGELPERLLAVDLLADLQYLLVPLLVMAVLLLVLRLWPAARRRARWLRPTLLAAGVVLFAGGLLLPSVWLQVRDGGQQRELAAALSATRDLIDKVEQGTLASYRGASRDRALMDLLAGEPIARQKYTSYRFLSQLDPDFGVRVRELPDEFPVRPYWLPLERGRVETLHFDPPLRGEALYVVVGRPHGPVLPFEPAPAPPQVRLELGYGSDPPAVEVLTYDSAFVSGRPLGNEQAEVDWRRVPLQGQLRTLGVTAESGSDLRLVGLTLSPRRGEPATPLFLGTASLDGVLTDLRGAHPLDAGIELGPGATAKVAIPPAGEPFQKVWFFYRAIYPGVPIANPGASVAEIVLHFRGDRPARALTLEHQVSMFYELAVHNTRDQPPDGSPAAIAFAWVDETKERHINMVYPVPDLPADAELEAIEFRNVADYRMRFRSVVFGTERAAAPQDAEDSPLVRDGQDRRLRADVLQALAGTTIAIYRDGRLSESTLGEEQREDLLSLPSQAAEHADAARPLVADLPSGGRRAAVYAPLTGDGWDGATLAVAVADPGRAATRETASRIGLALCLCGAPLLLVLLSELLAAVANLRIRLMAVLSAAALVPLVVLSLVLAQVLEQGHESDQKDGMRRVVQSATGQLADQMQRLRGSATQWLQDLSHLFGQRVGAAPPAQLAAQVEKARPALQQLMGGQLPPEWRGGFLKLEWNPTPPVPPGDLQPIVAGDARLATTEAPARLEPGVYVHWGTVVIAVRSEAPVRGGTLALTVARPLDPDFLGALAPGQSVLLCDTRGFPLEVAGARVDPQALLTHGRLPAVMQQRERALFAALDRRQPVVERAASVYGDWLCAHTVLRDLQTTPRALLVLAQPDQRATLDLPIGRIPVRAFFFLVAGLLIVLSGFLSFVISGRISRPVELLEEGALQIARGQLATRVPVEERGQLGRLSRAFNRMAGDLEGRLFDLQKLNRVMRDLSAQLDADHTLQVLRRFCEQHGPVDRVRTVLLDPSSGRLELHGGSEVERFDPPPELAFLPRAAGPFCLCWPGGQRRDGGLLQRLPGVQSVVGLPLLVGGRCRGAVLLLFESATPGEMELDLLATVVAQAAVALDNAQLYRHAVQDPVTGAFVPDYFRRRVAEEAAVAQQRGTPLSLSGFALGDGTARPRGLRRFALLLRELAPGGSCLCHAETGQFQLLVAGQDRAAAEAVLERVVAAWREIVERGDEDVEHGPPATAVVMFPEEAASAEFLFELLRVRLVSGTPGAASSEVDASLQRAGITAVSPVMRDVYRTLRRVAPTDLAILILGETGSGKEVLTNLAHRWSRRAQGPLVKVHCAALSETLLASELFGHERGAFTGAERRKIGKFEQADGGTIFLDEVGEIPLDVQVKLLRVLQEREVDRVGGVDPVPVDVRVVAATNRDIERMVAEGRFREDLYYRLQGIVVHVPPLRERKQEIPALVEQFRSEVVASGQSQVRGFSTDAMDELFRRDWPGNIRELRNAVYRAMVLASGEVVERRDVLAALPASSPGALPPPAAVAGPAAAPGVPAEPAAASGGEEAPVRTAEGAVEPASGTVAAAGPPPVLVPRPPARDGVPAPATSDPTDGTDGRDGAGAPDAPDGRDGHAGAPAAAAPGTLAPRVRALYQRLLQVETMGTQDHMRRAGVSHRTGLRDLQQLVDLGLAERIGSRRGARYRAAARPPGRDRGA